LRLQINNIFFVTNESNFIFANTFMAKRDLPDFSFDDLQYAALALHCGLPPHHMAWLIDEILHTKFTRKVAPLEVPLRKNLLSAHVFFHFDYEPAEHEFWLVENKGTEGILAISRPDPDYLIIGNGENGPVFLDEWIGLLKNRNEISLVYKVTEEQKSRLNWLPYLEEQIKPIEET
jgi:hypothetical protein